MWEEKTLNLGSNRSELHVDERREIVKIWHQLRRASSDDEGREESESRPTD